MQSDQCIFVIHSGKYNSLTCNKSSFSRLASRRSRVDGFETKLVGNPKDVGAHMGLDASKPVFRVWEQHRRRPACASAQFE